MGDLSGWSKIIESTPEEIKKRHERQKLLSKRDAYCVIYFGLKGCDEKRTIGEYLEFLEKEIQDINKQL